LRNKLFSAEFQRTFPTIPDLYLVSAYTLWTVIASSVVMSREAVRKHGKKKKRGLSRGVWFLIRMIFVRMFRPATRTSANLTADSRRTERQCFRGHRRRRLFYRICYVSRAVFFYRVGYVTNGLYCSLLLVEFDVLCGELERETYLLSHVFPLMLLRYPKDELLFARNINLQIDDSWVV